MTTPTSPAPGSGGAGYAGPSHPFWLAASVGPPQGSYRWVYLWHWPIRAMHWAAALSIIVLIVTGFYIGAPYFAPPESTRTPYLMGWIRLTHFVAAGVLVATGIIRAYWLIAGDKFERLPALFPVRPRDWKNLFRMVKYYLMIHPERAPHYLGHNPLQQFSYTLVYAVTFVMALTGFALYGQSNPGGVIYLAFAWVPHVLGGLQIVRFVHHVAAWFFLIFIPLHIYLAVRSDVIDRSGSITSIVSGGRFVPADEQYADE